MNKRPHSQVVVSALSQTGTLPNHRRGRVTSRSYLSVLWLAVAVSLSATGAFADDINCDPMTGNITFIGKSAVVVEKTSAGVEITHSSNFVSNAASQYKLNYCKKCQTPFTDPASGPGSSLVSHMKSIYLPQAVFCYGANSITTPEQVPDGVTAYAAAIKTGLTSLMGHRETTLAKDTKLYHGTDARSATAIITQGPALLGNGMSGTGFYTSSDKALAVAFGRINQSPADVIQFDLKKDLPVCKIPSALRNDNVLNIFPLDRYRRLLQALGTDCALMRNKLNYGGVTGTEVVFWTNNQLKYLGNRKRQKE